MDKKLYDKRKKPDCKKEQQRKEIFSTYSELCPQKPQDNRLSGLETGNKKTKYQYGISLRESLAPEYLIGAPRIVIMQMPEKMFIQLTDGVKICGIFIFGYPN